MVPAEPIAAIAIVTIAAIIWRFFTYTSRK
jgi:hypothetical protein